MNHAFEQPIIIWYDLARISRKKSDIWAYFILTHTEYLKVQTRGQYRVDSAKIPLKHVMQILTTLRD